VTIKESALGTELSRLPHPPERALECLAATRYATE
jgi:hypothetical protein